LKYDIDDQKKLSTFLNLNDKLLKQDTLWGNTLSFENDTGLGLAVERGDLPKDGKGNSFSAECHLQKKIKKF
jgi:hypothetical protein